MASVPKVPQQPLLSDMHTDGVRFDREVLAAFKARTAQGSDAIIDQTPD